METPLLVLFVLALFFGTGYGPVALLGAVNGRANRVVLMPLAGFSYFLLVTHLLAAFGLIGTQVAWMSLPLLALPALCVPKGRRIARRELRESLPVLAVAASCVLIVNWPLLVQGYRGYMAYANPDAAFNTAVWDSLMTLPYGVNPTEGFATIWPNPKFGVVFGSAYLGVFLSTLFGVDVHALHQVVCGPIALFAPLGTWLLARVVFLAGWRTSLLVAVFTAVSSQLAFTVCLQSLGAITLTAMLPAVLATWSDAFQESVWRRAGLASLLTVAVIYGYYASLPILVALVGVGLAAFLARRQAGAVTALAGLGTAAALFLLCFPRFASSIVQTVLFESTSARMVASLDGKEILLGFAFSLTESYLPFFWGLGYPHWDAERFSSPFSVYVLFVYLLGAGLLALAVFGLREAKGTRGWAMRAQVALMTIAILYFRSQNNGYGVFKFAAWWNPVFLTCAVIGGLALFRDLPLRVRSLTPLLILTGWFSVNLYQGAQLCWKSLAGREGSMSMAKGLRMDDFLGLREMAGKIPKGDKVLVVVPERVVLDWAISMIYRQDLAVIPVLWGGVGVDEEHPMKEKARAGMEKAKWVLTMRRESPNVVWRNGVFQLAAWEDTRNLMAIGGGWYEKETLRDSIYAWQHDFRWLRRRGEIHFLRGGGEEMRLRAVVVAGPGDPRPDRSLRLLVNGRLAGEADIRGSGTMKMGPFRAEGDLSSVTLELDDSAKPIPRPFGLLNRWVPKDYRRLNVAIAGMSILPGNGAEAPPYPAGMRFPIPATARGFEYNGVYPDGWVASPAQFTLNACGSEPALVIDGFVPRAPGLPFPYPLEVIVNRETIRHAPLDQPGEFHLTMPVRRPDSHCEAAKVELVAPSSYRAPEGRGDPRPLSVRIKEIGIRGN